jgi:predicted component of type VI protein secretion system
MADDNILEIKDDFTGDKIALNIESIDQILDAAGNLDSSLLKEIFDNKYIQDAVSVLNDNTDNIFEVISDLGDKAVEIKDINQSSYSDENILGLSNIEKAKIFYLH